MQGAVQSFVEHTRHAIAEGIDGFSAGRIDRLGSLDEQRCCFLTFPRHQSGEHVHKVSFVRLTELSDDAHVQDHQFRCGLIGEVVPSLATFHGGDHNVARVHVGMCKVVDEDHLEKGRHANRSQLVAEPLATTVVLAQKAGEHLSVLKALNEHCRTAKMKCWFWKTNHRFVCFKVLSKANQMFCLLQKIHLRHHAVFELFEGGVHVDVLQVCMSLQQSTQNLENPNVLIHLLRHTGMLNFDGDNTAFSVIVADNCAMNLCNRS
mmetsp:Transcript_17683/g.53003  ORF Transcript_17683/g.53003 Transcript_17683/m.53003 type:complete len:263 (-) Transcript_17683:580-1368(-)